MISSKVIIAEAELKVRIDHERCSDPGSLRDKDIFIESNSIENNTLSTIEINDDLKVYVFWESFSSAESLEVLFIPETGVLFLGCGALSAIISTTKRKLIDLNYLCLFWGFKRHRDYILQTGELECFLYTLAGKEISRTDVDPPYEIVISEQGIKFESSVIGTTWLKYAPPLD